MLYGLRYIKQSLTNVLGYKNHSDGYTINVTNDSSVNTLIKNYCGKWNDSLGKNIYTSLDWKLRNSECYNVLLDTSQYLFIFIFVSFILGSLVIKYVLRYKLEYVSVRTELTNNKYFTYF